MPNYTTSANMQLLLPTVGNDPGPDWATNLNASLTLIDQHDHSNGSGVRVTPSGLNINSDLSFSNNNLTAARSLRLQPQSAALAGASDLGCLYEVTNDLYYNDGLGNQVRITQNGGVAGSPGSIANLTSPASAAYVSANSTFVWESAASTPANLDAASLLMRNLSANSFACTLSPPAAMGANFALTLPSLPGSGTKIVQLDNTGAMSATLSVDNTTLQNSSNLLSVKASGVGTTQLATGAVTKVKEAVKTTGTTAAAGNVAISAAGTTTTSSTSFVDCTNQSVTIDTLGSPVRIVVISSGSTSQLTALSGGSATANTSVQIVRDSTVIAIYDTSITANAPSAPQVIVPPSAISGLDTPAAGTYTYKLQIKTNNGANTAQITNVQLVAYEL